MRRRDFLGVLSGVAAWPIAAHAQQPERIRRVGVLMPFTNQDFVDRDDVVAFTQEFRRLGWEQGRNFQLEYRGVAPHISQLQTTAAELVGLKPEVILVLGGAALKAVQANDNSIPIVFVGVTDPAEQGFVANLEHPGGNLTGFAVFESSVCSKWLQLLREILPDLKHFAVIYNPETTTGNWLPLIKSIAQGLGLEVNEAAVYVEDDIDNVLGPLKTTSNAGVIVLPSAFTMLHRQRIIDFAGRWQLPAVYWNNRFVKVGGLMSYSYNLDAQEREGVTYVDRILKGEKPGNLPVQETTKFELVVNLKTAKALGITVPMSLIARADEVIE